MCNNETKKVGVIVGRFQTDKLTEGHLWLFDHVKAKGNAHMALILGIPPQDVRLTKRNPLPYQVRKALIENQVPGTFSTIKYVVDVNDPEKWSAALDAQVDSIVDMLGVESAVLYGSRHSFIDTYRGKYECEELQSPIVCTASKARIDIANTPEGNQAFARGIIYAVQNNWTQVFPTIDCAIAMDKELTKFVFAKKAGEKLLRFVGGFVDWNDKSLEAAAVREAKEETGLTCHALDYVCSSQVDDWRYRGEKEKILTTMFLLLAEGGVPEAADDIAETHIRDINTMDESEIMDGHRVLFRALKERLVYLNHLKNLKCKR